MLNCKKSTLIVDRVIALCELNECRDVNIVGKVQMRSVQLEVCRDTKIELTKETRNCKVIMTSSRDTWITAPGVEGENVGQPVKLPCADSFMVTWLEDKDDFHYEDVKGLE